MERRTRLSRLINDQSGAVAATYALALVGLVSAAGVGYDFARLATMSSELHNAADQAALAAATQLDGTANAITNAKARASDLVQNKTLLSNDGGTTAIAIDANAFAFYKTKADAEADDTSKATTDPTLARYVRLKVVTRQAYYAFTPIVNALSSGAVGAAATAGLGSAVCKVPPVMMCNTAVDPTTFSVASLIGKGLLLKATGGSGSWAPGDFGFLDVGAGSGASDLSKLIAYGTVPGDCTDFANPSTEPGALSSVIDDFNTRFDIFNGGDSINCYSQSLCPGSDNSRKDLVQSGNLTTASTLTQQDCGLKTGGGSKGWDISPNPYRPITAAVCSASNKCGQNGTGGSSTTYPDAMGYSRDLDQATGDPLATGGPRIGSGTWDVNAYWNVNYGTNYAGQVNGKSAPTRYEVYRWERTNANASRQFNSSGNYTDFKVPMCRAGAAPGATSPDRRVLPVAVVNCTGLSGKKAVTPLAWIDVFLVEPSVDRSSTTGSGKNKVTTTYTNKGDIYVEVIGLNQQSGEGAAPQFVRRDKPFLVR